ncbi:MAG: inorganic phosphate transporter [Acidobacteria bacterium]|nr:inorganic phosphate transporter [Acidobacteriota bacterium]
MNGFHDAANSIATIVSTRVLSPKYAVVWAAFFNFVAFLVFGLHVANTIGKGIVRAEAITFMVILAALIGATVWDIITWWLGLPTSSSHALIGGFAGAALVYFGFDALIWAGLQKVVLFIVVSPLLGLIFALLTSIVVHWTVRHQTSWKVDTWFRRLQLVSAGLYSLGHGGNDAQKTMGIIAILLFKAGYLGPVFYIPLWIVLACHAAIALGTLFGGWRIVKTMGMRMTRLRPIGGFCAETAGAATLFLATGLGIPVSTTHTITGAIVGVGATHRVSAVRWGIAGRIIWAWILTIPGSAIIAAATYAVARLWGYS